MGTYHHRHRWHAVLASSVLVLVFIITWQTPLTRTSESLKYSDSKPESFREVLSPARVDSTAVQSLPQSHAQQTATTELTTAGAFADPTYLPGTTSNRESSISRTLVVAATSHEDTGWIMRQLGGDAHLHKAIYVVDDPTAEYAIPNNKGHEVMVYLTHIIDHYNNLTDIIVFMHAHRVTWHNNDLLESDSAEMVKHLSSERVIREGYMNMRCHLDPGCPAHIRPLTDEDDINVPEAVTIGRAWKELFPQQEVPEVLSQPCCAQLAVSRDRIRALPREQYIFFRDWLLQSPLEDRIAGRIFEYVWQYIWTGSYEFCPKEHVCYCDGYGVCFGGEDEYALYFALRDESRKIREEVQQLEDYDAGDRDPEYGRSLVEHAEEVEEQMAEMKDRAFERGRLAKHRADEAGRPWMEGDGF